VFRRPLGTLTTGRCSSNSMQNNNRKVGSRFGAVLVRTLKGHAGVVNDVFVVGQ